MEGALHSSHSNVAFNRSKVGSRVGPPVCMLLSVVILFLLTVGMKLQTGSHIRSRHYSAVFKQCFRVEEAGCT
jgi:hypothetical protein